MQQPNATTVALLSAAFKAVHIDDAAALRAADKAVDHLRTTPALTFDPTELRVVSSSRGREGIEHVTNATGCTCEGGRHPWCFHRAEFRLLLAELALRDPAELIRLVIEQTAPAESELVAMEAAEAVARVESLMRGPEILPFDPTDDAEYARIITESEDARARFAAHARASIVLTGAEPLVDELYP